MKAWPPTVTVEYLDVDHAVFEILDTVTIQITTQVIMDEMECIGRMAVAML